MVTTAIAIALAMVVNPISPELQGIGLSFILYWLAKGLFALSKQLPSVARESVFLLGLPIYLGAIVFFVLSVARGLLVR